MIVTAFLIFLILAFAAAAFVVWPVLRKGGGSRVGRLLLAAALLAFVLAIGLGGYLVLGTPALAVRSLTGTEPGDIGALVSELSVKMRERPGDAHGWELLGRGYLTLNDSADAAKSFARAIAIEEALHRHNARLLSSYGEALTEASGGAVPKDAETAFEAALAIDPKDQASRYYLGLADVSHGRMRAALALWQSLLADAPVNAPWRGELVDRIAQLKAANGAAPDINAMVAGLAARLKAQPDDAAGWQRLIRAYTVLGQKDKAIAALADARAALKSNPSALAALNAQAAGLKLAK
ncbi:MAG TPA: hypothetical protein VHW02_11160 [Rhizomicrobium sp.]|jgi:cytochrome c-type biogenesis protein CcmH|nr:hypothetical protein [Rhizomicrobium sp.]